MSAFGGKADMTQDRRQCYLPLGHYHRVQDFRVGEPVVVTARIEVEAKAIGSGSHAEVNFKDGDANFIQPQGLWVSSAGGAYSSQSGS